MYLEHVLNVDLRSQLTLELWHKAQSDCGLGLQPTWFSGSVCNDRATKMAYAAIVMRHKWTLPFLHITKLQCKMCHRHHFKRVILHDLRGRSIFIRRGCRRQRQTLLLYGRIVWPEAAQQLAQYVRTFRLLYGCTKIPSRYFHHLRRQNLHEQ